jgi:hypothetical protein
VGPCVPDLGPSRACHATADAGRSIGRGSGAAGGVQLGQRALRIGLVRVDLERLTGRTVRILTTPSLVMAPASSGSASRMRA